MADTTGYQNLLANGLNDEDGFTPFHLFAGESQTVTGQIKTGASALVILQIYALDKDNVAVPWDPTNPGRARATITVAAQPTAADTLTINGQAMTFEAGAPADSTQAMIGGTTAATAANIAAAINAENDEADRYGVFATVAGNVVSVYAAAEGAEGNAVTLAKSGTNPTLSGANLSGGGDNSTAEPVGAAAQAVPANSEGPSYEAGYFNHAALVWPPTVNDYDARKRAFAGKPFKIGKVL